MQFAIPELYARMADNLEDKSYLRLLELFAECYQAGRRDGKFELLKIVNETNKRVADVVEVKSRGALE